MEYDKKARVLDPTGDKILYSDSAYYNVYKRD